jgi:rhodanese-related sulfurtransferase
MKINILFLFLIISALSSCGGQKSADSAMGETVLSTISVGEFEKKLKDDAVQLIDVRTAEEFAGGYIKNAVNIDVNSSDFDSKLVTYDKNIPVLVYCLSGGRSSAAADRLNQLGFKQVYNLDGGIMKWQSANKEIVTTATTNERVGMSKEDFLKVVAANKKVLVDFNAKWCAPCKKMLPMLEALAEKNKDKFILLQIDADENKELLKEMQIDAIPYFQLYENGKLIWTKEGLSDESEFKKALEI